MTSLMFLTFTYSYNRITGNGRVGFANCHLGFNGTPMDISLTSYKQLPAHSHLKKCKTIQLCFPHKNLGIRLYTVTWLL
jgi:hypothetical protein